MLKFTRTLSLLFIFNIPVFADEDKLVLEVDFERDLLSLSHDIDEFLFTPTRNYPEGIDKNINDMASSGKLKQHLAATALVRMDDEVVGFVTEQEIVYTDPETQHPVANSMWMFRLNHAGLTGFLAVEQMENASGVFALVQKVLSDPEKAWEDRWHMFLSTSNAAKVQYASGELSKYQGGVFEEYNGVNPGDFKQLGRFRGKIKFIIYPGG